MSKYNSRMEEMNYESEANVCGKLVKEPVFNVVGQDEFQERVKQIFQILDNILGKSFGAYGAPTIISNYPYSHATKDGYTIAKNIVFDHINGSQADRVIAGMAIDICGRLNYAVGDGTTSAIIATNQIYKAAINNEKLKRLNIRPKNLIEAFDRIKDEVVAKLQEKFSFNVDWKCVILFRNNVSCFVMLIPLNQPFLIIHLRR